MSAVLPSSFDATDTQRLLDVVRAQTQIASLGLDLGAVMHLAANRAQHLTDCEGAVIEMAEGEEMVYRATSGTAAPQLGMRIPRTGSLSGLCVQEGRTLVCEDVETDGRVNVEACRRIGLKSMIVMPLRHHNEVVGVLKVLSSKTHAFNQADVRILGLVSELIAASMFYASRHQSEDLVAQATHDSLTKLPNRALFYERLNNLVAFAATEKMRFGVVSVDMNKLKFINDTWGHRAGDAALCELAARLRRSVRASDTVARVGGDEFAILITHVGDVNKTRYHINRVKEDIKGDFDFEGNKLPICASLGLAIYPLDGTDLTQLVDRADQAMYSMKRSDQSDQ